MCTSLIALSLDAFTPSMATISISSSSSLPQHQLAASSVPLSSPRNSAYWTPHCCSTVHGGRNRFPASSLVALPKERGWLIVRSGETADLLHTDLTEVAPLLLPRKGASHSALRNHFCCSSSSNGSSSIYQPRPAIILPGLGNNSGDYLQLQAVLEGYGITSVTANVSRPDWLRNAAGLLDLNYWKGTLLPRPVLDWYLKRVDTAIQEAKERFPGKTLSLIGHSAGGWLARVYMEEFGTSDISLLLTLGTPHTPPPKGVSGVIDQTRGLLDYVHKHCAKAVYTPELKYVCVAGRYIQGARIVNESSEVIEDTQFVASNNNDQEVGGIATMAETTMSTSTTATFRARFIGQGYKQVCGRADVWGDGVVPEESAYLEGALNIGIEGVYHSPVGSDDVSRPWYGSPAIVEQWIDHLLDK